MREIQATSGIGPPHFPGLSLWFGIGLVVMGVVVNAAAALHHTRLVGQLRVGAWSADDPSRAGVIAALVLSCAGLGVALYLVLVR